MLSSDAARTAFQNAGIRLTPQRLIIVNALVGNTTHPSVEQVYDLISPHYPTISLATVYKTIALLVEHGLLLELHGSSDGLRCDPNTTPHAHAYCQGCGTILDIPLETHFSPDAAALNGFKPQQVEISLFGLCAPCAASASSAN